MKIVWNTVTSRAFFFLNLERSKYDFCFPLPASVGSALYCRFNEVQTRNMKYEKSPAWQREFNDPTHLSVRLPSGAGIVTFDINGKIFAKLLCNSDVLSCQLQTSECQECLQTGTAGGDHRNTARLAELNTNTKWPLFPLAEIRATALYIPLCCVFV